MENNWIDYKKQKPEQKVFVEFITKKGYVEKGMLNGNFIEFKKGETPSIEFIMDEVVKWRKI